MDFWLKSIFGADDFQWMLSEDEGVREITLPSADDDSVDARTLSLEYAPIYKNDEVFKVMVIAKDISDLKALAQEVDDKDRQNKDNMDRVTELASMDPELFETFVAEAEAIFGQCDACVVALEADPADKDAINALFRAMHTLKGNARIFNITSVQDKAHAVEDEFQAIRDGERACNGETIADVRVKVSEVRALVANFEKLGRQVLMGEKPEDGTSTDITACLDETSAAAEACRAALVTFEDDGDSAVMAASVSTLEARQQQAHEVGLASLPESLMGVIRHAREAKATVATGDALTRLESCIEQTRTAVSEVAANESADTFVAEARKQLQDIGAAITAWRKAPKDRARLNALMRVMHSLKGNARTFGMRSVEDVTHQAEGALTTLRDGNHALGHDDVASTEQLVGDIRRAVADCAACVEPAESHQSRRKVVAYLAAVDAAEAGWPAEAGDAAAEVGAVLEALAQRGAALGLATVARAVSAAATASAEPKQWEAFRDARSRVRECVEDAQAMASEVGDCESPETFVVEAHKQLRDMGIELTAWKKKSSDRARTTTMRRVAESLKRSAHTAGMHSAERRAQDLETTLNKLHARKSAPCASDVATVEKRVTELRGYVTECESCIPKGDKKRRRSGPTIKVPEARVLEVRKHYKDLSRAIAEAAGNVPQSIQALYAELGDAVQSLTRKPLSELFDRYTKMVMDLSRELGKKVEDLQVEGGELQADQKLIEKMRDVLLHAIRNCVDHGIEMPDKRAAAGKPEKGRIEVHGYWEDGQLVFDIIDDGAGFDLERLKSKALEKRLITEEKADAMNEDELARLAFLPGMSTAKKVTDVSGRGVGMDVVASTMRDLGGSAELKTTPGRGSTLTLKIPADYYQKL